MSGRFTAFCGLLLAGFLLGASPAPATAAKGKPVPLKLYVLTPNFAGADSVPAGERGYVGQVLVEELHGLPWLTILERAQLGEALAARLDACPEARCAARLLGSKAERILVLAVAAPKRRQFVMSASIHGPGGQVLSLQSQTETAPDELKYAVPGLIERLFAREIAAMQGAGGLTRIEESLEIRPEKEPAKQAANPPAAEPGLDLDIKDAATLLTEARELLAADETTRAEDLLRRAMKSGDCPLEARLYLARILCESGRREEALPLLRAYLARESRPEFAEDKRQAKLLLTGF